MKRATFVSGAAALLLAAATACSSGTSSSKTGGTGGYGSTGGTSGGGSSTSAPSTSAPSKAATITIAGFKFTGPLTVPAGATVTVSNTDGVDHTVTADSGGSFDVSVPAGQTVTFTAPSTAGTYKYHCTIHPYMHGTLIVS